MKDRCPKSVGDAKQTLEIRVELRGAVINMSTYIICTLISKGTFFYSSNAPEFRVESSSEGPYKPGYLFFTVPMYKNLE